MKKTVDIIKKPERIVLSVSDLVVFINILCGVLSIFFSINREFGLAILFMVFAFIFGFIKSMVERTFTLPSKIGEYLNQAGDMVSFATAPVAFTLAFYSNFVMILPSIILVIAAAFSLSRLSYLKNENLNLTGMPISWNAVIFAAIYFIKASYIITAITMLIISYLLISRIRFTKIHE
jgi:phosphatidylserine synthase